MPGIELRTSDTQAKALPLGHVEHIVRTVEILLLKPSSLIKREFKDIFQKNDCSFDSENPTKMHFIAFTCKEWKPNSLGQYGINSSTMFAHMLRLLNYPKSFPFALKVLQISKFIERCPSAPLFVDAVSAWAVGRRSRSRGFFGVKSSPARINNSAFLCLLFCCMRNGLSFTDS